MWVMDSQRTGLCARCGRVMEAGTTILYDTVAKTARHAPTCPPVATLRDVVGLPTVRATVARLIARDKERAARA